MERKKQISLDILDSYKKGISDKSFRDIKEVIGNMALESFFADEENIINMIDISEGCITAEELIEKYKKKWGV